MKLKPNEVLLVEGGLGRYHQVTAVFVDSDAANAYLATILARLSSLSSMASSLSPPVDDLGIPFPLPLRLEA